MIEHQEIAHQMPEMTFYLFAVGMAFSRAIRYEVRRRQGNRCDCCGEPTSKLQVHHRVPESLGGSSHKIANAVGVCQDCHRELDVEAFAGILYPQVHTDAGYFPQGNGLGRSRQRFQ